VACKHHLVRKSPGRSLQKPAGFGKPLRENLPLRARTFFRFTQDVEYFYSINSVVKNKADRVVILNDVTRSVVESMRGQHDTHVFTYEGPARQGFGISGCTI
jgi:hypothetical protein